MDKIEVSEKYLAYRGDTEYALRLVNSLREAYGHNDMPKMLNDFVFGIEVALQNTGVLDADFNEVTRCCCGCGCAEPPTKSVDHPDVWPSCPECGMV